MFTICDIIYSDGFVRLSATNDNRFFVTCSFDDDESTVETNFVDVVDTVLEATDESKDCECTVCMYNAFLELFERVRVVR